VGLKPARGRVSSRVPGWQGMAIEGAVCKTVADAAAVLDVISEPDPLAWAQAPAPEHPFSSVVGSDLAQFVADLKHQAGADIGVHGVRAACPSRAPSRLAAAGFRLAGLATLWSSGATGLCSSGFAAS